MLFCHVGTGGFLDGYMVGASPRGFSLDAQEHVFAIVHWCGFQCHHRHTLPSQEPKMEVAATCKFPNRQAWLELQVLTALVSATLGARITSLAWAGMVTWPKSVLCPKDVAA